MKHWTPKTRLKPWIRGACITHIPAVRFCQYYLTVETIYGYKSDFARSLLAAKHLFGRHFQTGVKWNETEN